MLAEARKLATEVEKDKHHLSKRQEKRSGPITKRQLDNSFKSQLKSAEHEMTTAERIISRFIHIKPIEKTVDFAAITIARPNAMLCGSIAAFAGVTIVYFISKYYAFQLTGFETIGTFLVGWIIGLLYDYFTVMIRGRK